MKRLAIGLVALAAVCTQAALVHFQLSPAGTDTAVGLSPSNEVPAAVTSTGSGGTVSGGIVLDTDTSILDIAVGYGSAAGFTDLSGAATAMHLHGPAGVGTNAGVVVSLVPYNFTAADPARGGVIVGKVPFPTNDIPNLLAGLFYLNVHTATHPGGEIRGQLIAVAATNSPPSITCPGPSVVECPAPAEVTVLVSDPDGDALTVVWSVDGTPFRTNSVAASNPPAAANLSFSESLALGAHVVGVLVTDSAGNTASCSSAVTVVDTVPPVITSVSATPNSLWPPNHKMVPVKINATVTDACGPTTWKIIRVTSNEPVNEGGSGNTAPDWKITGDHAVNLRAERSGRGDGRTYTITIQAVDAAGNLSQTATTTVNVPKSQGNRGKG